MTQTQLAAQLGTTAATVSRLETADMTVSTDWLERIAKVLGVDAMALIDAPQAEDAPGIACLGEVRRGGRVTAFAERTTLTPMLTPAAGAHEPAAFRVMEQMGSYCAGDILITDRMPAESAAAALGHDCFAADETGALAFGRLVAASPATLLMVPPEAGAAAVSLTAPGWIAPVVTLIRRFPGVRALHSGN
ncbi:MAG: helix-turn-helix domain-containing protein [Parvibaculum sp.]|nr:helix-turn-helix domain-containing protein [Parvibaculum sp.]